MYIWLENFRKLFTQAPVVQTQQNLFLVFIWQVLCLFRNHTICLCHRESVSWQNGSVVSSAAWWNSADALKFESLSTQIILDWIGLDWIGLFCIQMRIWNQWSREGSIRPTEVPVSAGLSNACAISADMPGSAIKFCSVNTGIMYQNTRWAVKKSSKSWNSNQHRNWGNIAKLTYTWWHALDHKSQLFHSHWSAYSIQALCGEFAPDQNWHQQDVSCTGSFT
jgi:hypothetical protein